uniref:Uncharacterized protein n=1 Tax=candidate division CPR3 bacterium TaxID=2268181 RepID=A0A7C4R2Q4_UNCC3
MGFEFFKTIKENKEEISKTIKDFLKELEFVINNGTDEEKVLWKERVLKYGFNNLGDIKKALEIADKNIGKSLVMYPKQIGAIKADLKGKDGLLNFLVEQQMSRRAKKYTGTRKELAN